MADVHEMEMANYNPQPAPPVGSRWVYRPYGRPTEVDVFVAVKDVKDRIVAYLSDDAKTMFGHRLGHWHRDFRPAEKAAAAERERIGNEIRAAMKDAERVVLPDGSGWTWRVQERVKRIADPSGEKTVSRVLLRAKARKER